jgi:hypothetical protein
LYNRHAIHNVVNKRHEYLFKTLGLGHDPFAFASAELELQVNSEDPPFLSYFVDLPINASQGSLLEKLKQPGHAVIYGAAGSGKTALRYTLEAHCRALAERILVVSQPLGKGGPRTAVTPPALPAFIEALATDLFVQTLEQFDILPNLPDPELTIALSYFWHQHIPNFKRNVERHLRQGQPTGATSGISLWWRTWKRLVVRYTPLTTARLQFLEKVLAIEEGKADSANHQALQQGSQLAHRLGFRQIYYLIDVADTSQLNIPQLFQWLCEVTNWPPLLAHATPISLKLFLPQRLKELSQEPRSQLPDLLLSPSFSAIIAWKDQKLLQALIANRFRSAGSWIRGFEVLASQEIAIELSNKLLETAQQSPRRMLQTVSQLINTHAERAPDDPTITAKDWQHMCASWSYSPPPPPSLMLSNSTKEGNKHDQRFSNNT